MYYKKCLEKTKIDATWNLIRWKMRHLKASFKKAEDWRNSTGAGILEADEGISSVRGKIFSISPLKGWVIIFMFIT